MALSCLCLKSGVAWPGLKWAGLGTEPTILMSGSELALGREPDLSSLRAEDLLPLLSSPEDRAPSDRKVLTPLSERESSSILKKNK